MLGYTGMCGDDSEPFCQMIDTVCVCVCVCVLCVWVGGCVWVMIVYKASKVSFVSKLSSRKQYKNNILYSLESFTDESSKLKNEEIENESVHS